MMKMFDPKKPFNDLPLLPGNFDYNNIELLKLSQEANFQIAKLDGLFLLSPLPKFNLIMAPLLTRESVESSAIENINTTTNEVLKSEFFASMHQSGPEKEVLHYREALIAGYERIQNGEPIYTNMIIDIQQYIESNKAGIRQISGTVIANSKWEVLYTPPEGEHALRDLLHNLEVFMNTENDIDPLIKLWVIHYQFESIHPFLDGNGRMGRILMILFLLLSKKLTYPILYISEYINKHRTEYYDILRRTSELADYSAIIKFMLNAVIEQAKKTQQQLVEIKRIMDEKQTLIKKILPNSHEITQQFFNHPFIGITKFADNIGLSRQTASKYLSTLTKEKIISEIQIGKSKVYFMPEFINLL